MQRTIIVMVIIALILMMVAYFQASTLPLKGLEIGVEMTIKIIPLLIFAFIIAGYMQVLIPQEMITKWLGEESGFIGIMLGSIAGGIIPGGPYVSFPIAASFLKAGAELGTVVAFVAGKAFWSLSRLVMEVAILGPKLTAIRYGLTLVFPPLAGLLANLLFSRFSDDLVSRKAGEN
ncbi:permease [Selenihalanaerobacter shriftii]|uniref:Predicted permease n=1 Tax=Selenihalanaerobacter shriftii TaxID=142842 RepID=A0A1T4LEU4_9FIRM|nr:permease [Selenihalanaerobacter shriftii]SJZ53146.1 Predicted permease [Selenihalanaerobacter shriftii]